MKFNCSAPKVDPKESWHRFFPLIPRVCDDGWCRWLEVIERKGKYECSYSGGGWEYEYRAITKPVRCASSQ